MHGTSPATEVIDTPLSENCSFPIPLQSQAWKIENSSIFSLRWLYWSHRERPGLDSFLLASSQKPPSLSAQSSPICVAISANGLLDCWEVSSHLTKHHVDYSQQDRRSVFSILASTKISEFGMVLSNKLDQLSDIALVR